MIYVVGIGPGEREQMTPKALCALEKCDTIIGYRAYIALIEELLEGKEVVIGAMMKEVDRCRAAVHAAMEGKTVAVVSSGDAGVYGMASLVIELCEEEGADVEVEVVAGVTAATSAAAVLGAPLSHDFAVISLSNLLTSWETIEKRLYHASCCGLAIALYNPVSKKRHDHLYKACEILLQNLPAETMCGYVKNIGREGQECTTLTLGELQNAQIDMFTTVIIGNESTRIAAGRLITPRGYRFSE